MVTMVANMDFAVGVNNTVKTNNEKASDGNFNKILNQQNKQTNKQIKESSPEKPAANVKPTNNNKHKIKNTEKPVQGENESKVDVEALEEVEAKIVDQVTKELNITEEQLNEMLAELNMTVFDLLLPDKLNTFLMALYNVEDSLELLTVPNAAANIKELKTELSELTKDCDLKTEDIKKIIAEVNQENDAKSAINQLMNSDGANDLKDSNGSSNLNDSNVSGQQAASKGQETSNNQNQSPQIDITDDRTDKSNMVKDETKVETAGNSSKEIFDNIQNISINQNVQKVEFVDQSGEKHVITYNINAEEVIEQIVSSFKVNLTDDVNKMFIQLRPEHLGKLAFSITTQEGVVTANFMAENPAVKELIEANLANLKMSLQEQGIEVDKLEVVVTDNSMFNDNNNSNQFNNNDNKKRRAAKMMKISSIQDSEGVEELLEDHENILSELEDNSSIDYSV